MIAALRANSGWMATLPLLGPRSEEPPSELLDPTLFSGGTGVGGRERDPLGAHWWSYSGDPMRARVVLAMVAVAPALFLTACGSSSSGGTSNVASGNAMSDQVAQTDLRTALTAAKATYQQFGNFGQDGPPEMRQFAPSLTFVGPEGVVTAGSSQVGVSTGGDNTNQTITLVALSASGTCWYLVDVASADSETLHGTSGIPAAGLWYGHTNDGASTCAAFDSGPPPASSLTGGWSSSGF